MSNKVKDVNIKNKHIANDIMGTEHFDLNNIKIDENSHIKLYIYYIGYYLFTVLDMWQLKNTSVNPLYLIFRYLNGYFEEINQNMYLMLVRSNESKEKSKKYKNLWIKIRDLIGLITKNIDDYDETFNSDDKLPLNK